ncbi:glycosyltransferase [Azospirillum sp. ST 5-10]|uniref:glycosyltransferase n=1 Tax=unclassified Azospirillum TaxID=2630922 RepID=UPI003F4A477A
MSETLLTVALLLFALAAHPFTTYPLSLLGAAAFGRPPIRAPARRAAQRTAAPAAGGRPRYSVVLCAHNEEAVIAGRMANLLALAAPPGAVEILVYADACTDRTVEALRRFEGRVRVIVGTSHHGKSVGMNTLLANARGDLVVFTDANVQLTPDCLATFEAHFADPAVGCVTGLLRPSKPRDNATAALGAAYCRFERWLKRVESETGSCMGADGPLFAIRRHLFRPVPADIIDDMFTSMSILCDGWRVVQGAEAVGVMHCVVRSAESYRRKERIACRAVNCTRHLWPRLRRQSPWTLYKFVSHKILRWVAGPLLALGGVALAASLAAGPHAAWAVPAMVAVPAVLALGAVAGVKAARLPFEVAVALAGTAVGVFKALRGDRYQTWRVAESNRAGRIAGTGEAGD